MPIEIGELNSRVEVRSPTPGQPSPQAGGLRSRKQSEFKKQVNQAVEQELRSVLRELD
jgi:hypothetical protein